MADEPKLPETINFDYLKSYQFRVIHADGAFFALTGQGGITVTFFAERQPIPRRVTHKVNSDGSIGEELVEQRVVRDAVIRDTEVAVTMNADIGWRVVEIMREALKRLEETKEKEKK